MNIFVTNTDPEIAAYEMCDIHNRKMICESAQMLSTAHHMLDSEPNDSLYKPTHKNHPCSIWVRQSKQNYMWLYSHYKTLCELFYEYRGKVHLTDKKLSHILCEPPQGISDVGLTQFAQAMPDEYKNACTAKAYQVYLNEKFRQWRERGIAKNIDWWLGEPSWLDVK